MNEKVNLEGIMYNKDGTFKPLTDSEGNTSGLLAHLRNTYMEAERNYFEHLLSIDTVRDRFLQYAECNSDVLFEAATNLQEQIEFGELETPEEKERMKLMKSEEREAFHMQKLEKAEGLMCLLLAATRDKILIKELTRSYSSGDRTR